jgi:hypothetical protein
VEPRLRALTMGVVFTAVAVGFAYAVPRAVESVVTDQVVDQIGAEDPPPDRNEPIDVGGSGAGGPDGEGGPQDNHGAAVSAAAHCDLAGAAHGAFESEVAKDKDITVEEVEARCEEAVASQESQGQGRPDKPGKPDRPGKSDGKKGKKEGNGPDGPGKSGGSDEPPEFDVPGGAGEPDEPGKGQSGEHGKPEGSPGGGPDKDKSKGGGGKN